MTVKDIYDFLDKIAPFDTAADWDNVGLLIGKSDTQVTTTIVCLDCNQEILNIAKDLNAQLIITHHPVIFDPLKVLDAQSLPWKLAESGISVISAHTNLDKALQGVNHTLCQKLNLDAAPCDYDPFLYIGSYSHEFQPKDWVDMVKNALSAPVIRAKFSSNLVQKVAVCCGSGGDFLGLAHKLGADTLITGDVKHNIFVEAAELNMNIVDAGHFHTENIIVPSLCEMLSNRFSDINFIPADAQPFTVH